MRVTIVKDDESVFGIYSTKDTLSLMLVEMDIDKEYYPSDEDVFEYMMEEVNDDAKRLFKLEQEGGA